MHNLSKPCVQLWDNVWVECGQSSLLSHSPHSHGSCLCVKPALVHGLYYFCTHHLYHYFVNKLPLLNPQLYPLSTQPIKTKTITYFSYLYIKGVFMNQVFHQPKASDTYKGALA